MNSLGIAKSEQQTRVVVAMSGGVDSSVVAAMLKEQGYDVIGITLQLYDHGEATLNASNKSCCAGRDIHDARTVAQQIDIPHYVLNYETRFQQAVIEDFADTYLSGQTPIPCVRCNQSVKFQDLLKTARDLQADVMATGHYVQRIMGKYKAQLHCARDRKKDQSYFLFATTQQQLEFLRFPLGNMHKDATRELASKYNLPIADKPDSQDICFVPAGNYASVVQKLRPGACTPGEIIHINGEVMGRHEGIINYTVGQRRGLNIGGTAAPLYVLQLDPIKHRVIVGPQEFLARDSLEITDLNWLGDAPIATQGQQVCVKLRSTQAASAAIIYPTKDGKNLIRLIEPQEGIAAGQACVIYDSDRVLGGGWILPQPPLLN